MSEQQDQNGAQFAMQRIYMKDSSFESPRSPQSFRGEWNPAVNLELNSRHTQLEENVHEVVLSVTVTARNDAEEILYLAEVQQAGIFTAVGFEQEALERALGTFCPQVLFPYAREAIDGMVTKGSFPALMLAPVNFDALYEQARAQAAQQDGAPH
ncbi:MAG TPA: protein-export chaperone SecB [Pseudomonadales bacterium]|nr:protein-export chaperone SecB [Pseudomonadales bacterium]